jgi:hypothetical protein
MTEYNTLLHLYKIIEDSQFAHKLSAGDNSYHSARLELVKDYIQHRIVKIENSDTIKEQINEE